MRRPRNPRAKALLFTGAAVMGIGVYAWFNGDPHRSHAAGGDPIDDYAIYGIGRQTAGLYRYEFASGDFHTIGTISDGTTDMTGIEAAAYVPGDTKIYGFWNDPSDGLSKLVYIDASTATGTPIGQDLGEGVITSAVAAMPIPSVLTLGPNEKTPLAEIMQYEIYAVQQTQEIDFGITNDQVVTNEEFAVRVKVLGAAISYGGLYDMPVTIHAVAGSDSADPFGDWTLPVDGNVNDDADNDVGIDPGDNPRSHVMPNLYTAGTSVALRSTAWEKTSSGYSGHDNSHWEVYRTVDTRIDTDRVIALRDGDPVPSYVAFLNQLTVVDFLEDYIDFTTNTMNLGPNQVIYLIEYNNTLSSIAADFQDLVVLVTLAKDTTTLQDPKYPTQAQLIKVDPTDGTKQNVMMLKNTYDGLAAQSGQLFFGSLDNQLYLIDPFSETEVLLGSLPSSNDNKALEFVGTSLYRHSIITDHIRQVDISNATSIGNEINIGASDLGSILFMRVADEPPTDSLYD